MAPTTDTLTVEFFSGLPHVAPVTGSDQRAAYDAFFRSGTGNGKVVAECSHSGVVIELVRGGMVVAIMSELAAFKTVGLVVLAMRLHVRTELTMICRPRASPAADALCQMLTHDARS
ncbi:LysR substrate-binding domain-containing protein [Rhodococcus sp. IEGM 1366]|uniref:LysR substrate-binding domain-containing protein n=1 Tax=Rhodococcus sp. IEGM 1366 TaxID=3082223 RepID=UPI002954894C|nr:LysR substrate-binding domain-containing protein [Rhodococcus sp. IEGM 1366]MDV8071011.1 LysR substrate-binding domain-containing protein [Rhodococcus sp. IEGM 1366]